MTKFPAWVRFSYQDEGKAKTYVGSMNNATMMMEAIHRLQISEDSIEEITVKDQELSKEQIKQTFALYYKQQQAIAERDEKLQQAIDRK